MKKFGNLLFIISLIFLNTKIVTAAGACEINTVKQLAKIVYHEVGNDYTSPASENFFGRLATASVALNHGTIAPHNTGSYYDRMMQYTNTEYAHYSNYKNKSFEDAVPSGRRGELLYVCALVLSGKFTLPKEVLYQAAESILRNDGATVFTNSANVYFGVGKYYTLSNTDIFGNTVSTDPQSLRDLAKSLEQSSYDQYYSDDVCNLVANITGSGGTSSSGGSSSNNGSTNNGGGGYSHGGPDIGSGDDSNLFQQQTTTRFDYSNICNNENVRQAFRIIGVIISVVKILVPLLLIIFGMIDLGKAVIVSDDKALSKAVNSLVKRFIAGIIVFFIPTLILFFMNWIEVTNGITSENDANFGSCTKCIFDPFSGNC